MGSSSSRELRMRVVRPHVHGNHDLLKALAVVLGAAVLTSVVSKRLRQPVVFGYIVAGLVLGPHVGLPIIASSDLVQSLAELGVVLLMFALGLEFSLRKLVLLGPRVTVTAVIQCSLLFWLGFIVGRAFGWSPIESLFTGALLSISSTTIIAKAFEEHGVVGHVRELVVGVLIVEDLIAIVLMAALTTLSSEADLSVASLAQTTAKLGVFLSLLVFLGLLVIPRATRRIIAMRRPEITLLASVALCCGIALLAQGFGYSVALGAFLAGSLIAESGEQETIDRLIHPVRDLFGAVFFVSVGMMMDPAVMVEHVGPIVLLTLVVVVGKILGVGFGAFLAGNGTRTSVRAAMSLAQIGEFSFIIAALGLSLGATRSFLYPVAIAVSGITTLLTPWLIRLSDPAACWVDRTLPRPLHMLGALYTSWLERMLSGRTEREVSTVRRLAKKLAIDAAIFAAIVIAGALGSRSGREYVVARQWLSPDLSGALIVGILALAAAPFFVGILRVGRRLGRKLAELALPPANASEIDLAVAARRALTVTLQLAIFLLVGISLVAVTQPFLPGYHGAKLLFGILVVLSVVSWRSARDLQGHVRAGAQVVVELLARQSRTSKSELVRGAPLLKGALEGLGEPVAIDITSTSPAVGKTLSDLDLRAMTGAFVLAIQRGEESVLVPGASERLRAGDVLAVAGGREAIASARSLLGVSESSSDRTASRPFEGVHDESAT